MKEPPKTCKFCKYFQPIPFSSEYICENANSMYADCPCEQGDSCSEWVSDNGDEDEV